MRRKDREIKFDYGPLRRGYTPKMIKFLEDYSRENIPLIFNEMVEMVQSLEGWAYITSNGLPGESVSFKPGLGDKFILRKLFEKYFPPKGPWPILDAVNPESIALRILAFEYCPSFGLWDSEALRQFQEKR